jgi:hypothetical protein
MLRAEGKAKDGVSYRAELKKTGGTAPGRQMKINRLKCDS